MSGPPTGRISEASIRSTLNSLKIQMRKKELKPGQFVKLIEHQARLQAELKIVVAEKIKTRLAEMDAQPNTEGDPERKI
jgi:hypothetical protein